MLLQPKILMSTTNKFHFQPKSDCPDDVPYSL